MKSDSDGSPADDAEDVVADADLTADSDDAASDEREPVAVGARASAGSARAAARASAQKAVTAGKGRPTRSRDGQQKRPNLFLRIVRYLREVVSELRKVIWPTRNEMVTYSIVVVLFLVFMVAFTWALDLGFAKAVLAIFG